MHMSCTMTPKRGKFQSFHRTLVYPIRDQFYINLYHYS